MSANDKMPVKFWNKVKKTDGCWLWTGRIGGRYGYGTFWDNDRKRNVPAHRVSFELSIGPIPKGLFVCHKCDNGVCVNPNHLFLGTPKDNTADMLRKEREARGTRNGAAKLKPENIPVIRELRRQGTSLDSIAERFGMSRERIRDIVRGITWKHIS